MTETPNDLFGTIEIAAEKQEKQAVAKPSRPAPKKKKKRGAPKKTKRPRSGGYFWFVLVALLLGAYSAAGFLLVPYLFKSVLPGQVQENFYLQLSQENVRFNPFNFRLGITNLSLKTLEDSENPEQLLTIDTIETNLDFLSLLRGDFVSSSMEIEGLDLRIVRFADKSYNISYLLEGSGLENQSDIIDFAELPFLFSLNNIRISDSRIIIYDQSSQKDHIIEDIELALPVISNFDYQNEFYISPRFSAVINGSPVSLTGDTSFGTSAPDSGQTQLSCDLNDIDIPLYFDYLPVSLPVDITKGTANGTLQLTFTPEKEEGGKVQVDFKLTTAELDIESRDSKLALSIPAANFEGSLEPFNNTLSFQNILLREPSVISQGEVTRTTLENLLPLTMRPAPEEGLHQVIPGLNIKLLIADGGSFNVLNSKGKKVPGWGDLQLSLKNFSNQSSDTAEAERTFRLSGAHQASSAYFTWQGTFDNQNQPGGNLQLNNISASRVAPFLGRRRSDVEGTADINGLLNLSLSSSEELPFEYTLKSTRVTVKELRLKDGGTVWLRTPVMRCEPVSRIKGITDLGNVFLQNSTAIINRDKLPHLFQVFGAQPTQHVLHGIDFSGSVKIVEPKSSTPALNLKNVVFQTNKLEQKQVQKDNFIFTAQLQQAEDVQAKGSFHIRPLQITTEISITNLAPKQLFTWFTDSKTLLTSNARISAKGQFKFPEQEFSGDLAAFKMRIGDPRKPVIQSNLVTFKGFSWSKTRESMSVKQLVVDQPEFDWRRLKQDEDPATLTSIFLRHILLPEPTPGTKDPDLALSRFKLEIDQINITDGLISYRDERTLPPLVLGLTGINGSLLNISYPVAQEKSTVSLTGNIEGHPFTLETEGNLMQSPPTAQAQFTAKALPLTLFKESVDRRIRGLDLSSGVVDIDFKGTWQDQGNSAETALTFSGIKPQKSGSATARALGVLAGADGSISKRFQNGDPSGEAGVVNDALDYFTRLMIKGSLDPMLVAGPDFRDLVEQQFVSFLPGTDEMTGESMERLGRYSQFLAAHPLVNLEVSGYSDQMADAPVLKAELEKAEQKRVDQENSQRAAAWHKQQLAKEKARKEKLKAQNRPILETDLTNNDTFVPLKPRPVAVTSKMLKELAENREKAVLDYLTQQLSVAPARVESGPLENRRIRNDGTSTRAIIKLADRFEIAKSGN